MAHDPVSFVRSLKLRHDETHVALSLAVESQDDKGRGAIVNKKSQGFVNRGALLSYDKSVEKDTKEDIMDIFSLAQMGASYYYDREKQTDKWYEEYTKVLMMVGFDIQSFNFVHYQSQEPSFQISKAVLDFVNTITAGDEAIKTTAMETMNALKWADSKTVELFSSNSSSPSNGNFQVGTVSTDATGTVQMATVVSYFSANDVKHNYFFFTYSNATLNMYKSAQVLIFNPSRYARVRGEIMTKLGVYANKDIAELPDFGKKWAIDRE